MKADPDGGLLRLRLKSSKIVEEAGSVIEVREAMTGAPAIPGAMNTPTPGPLADSVSRVVPPALLITYDQERISELDRAPIVPSVVIAPVSESPACCEG
jgi:hypothetical protein